jgi:hypothetical protein
VRPALTAAASVTLALVLACAAAAFADVAAVPSENVAKGEGPPPFEAAEPGARHLVEAIVSGNPELALRFFFPADAFDLVKAMAVPGRYHKKLVAWYREDILSEHPRFASGAWEFEKLERGRCKWQEKGTEGNSLPYWSCRGNRVTVRDGARVRTVEVHVIINWGKCWYVTHLGKIRS